MYPDDTDCSCGQPWMFSTGMQSSWKYAGSNGTASWKWLTTVPEASGALLCRIGRVTSHHSIPTISVSYEHQAFQPAQRCSALVSNEWIGRYYGPRVSCRDSTTCNQMMKWCNISLVFVLIEKRVHSYIRSCREWKSRRSDGNSDWQLRTIINNNVDTATAESRNSWRSARLVK